MRADVLRTGALVCERVGDHRSCRDMLYDELSRLDELASKMILNPDVF